MPPKKPMPKKDHKPRREPLPLDPEDFLDPAKVAAEVLAAPASTPAGGGPKADKLALVARILRLLAALLAGALGTELAHRLVQ